MSDDINTMVIRTSLRNMFEKGYVDITAIQKCLKLAGITPIGRELEQLGALHCVSFKDMDRGLVEIVPGMVATLFDGLTLNVSEFMAKTAAPVEREINPRPAEKHGFLRLLGVR